MPDASDHIRVARHNIDAIEYLLKNPLFSDWLATVTFYTALHIVDAILFADSKTNINHGETHNHRMDILKGITHYKHIHKHYGPLYRVSRIARYCENREGLPMLFSVYMPHEKVVDELIKHRLRQIIKTSANFLHQADSDSLKEKFGSLSVFADTTPLETKGKNKKENTNPTTPPRVTG